MMKHGVVAVALMAAVIQTCSVKAVTSDVSAMACSEDVSYSVVTSCDWNSKKHPVDYPSDAHWSPLCGTAHSSGASIFKVGEIATDGVKLVAETGSCDDLAKDVEACVAAGTCDGLQKYPCSAFDGTCSHTGTVSVSMNHPYVSFVSMVAPSPDWFVGVDSVALCEDGKWLSKYEKFLNPYDGGTDTGTTFKSVNAGTAQRSPITRIDAKDTSNIFYNSERSMIYPLCKISITLV